MPLDFWNQLAGPAVRTGGCPDLAFVLPDLIVGEYPTPADAEWLRAVHGVSSVLCLQDEIDLARKGLELGSLREAYARAGVGFAHVPIPDGDQALLGARLEETLSTLRGLLTSGERVYLHCNGGLNRAPTVAVAYLHACHGLSLDEACAVVKRHRPCVPYMQLLRRHYGG
jgi:protein-tyrosine phosphatase